MLEIISVCVLLSAVVIISLECTSKVNGHFVNKDPQSIYLYGI